MRCKWMPLAGLIIFSQAASIVFPMEASRQIEVDVQIKEVGDWYMMRQIPVPFPNRMEPSVPEERAEVLSLGRHGSESVVVIPDEIPDTMDGRSFLKCIDLVFSKIRSSRIARISELTEEDQGKTLLVFGTGETPILPELWNEEAGFLDDVVDPWGYRIQAVASPTSPDRQVVLALGKDWKGAASVATIFYLSTRRITDQLGDIQGWPISFPTEVTFWIPFEASYTLRANTVVLPDPLPPMPAVPEIPRGLRVWGSPMPTLESWQRMLREAKKLNIDSVIVQSGGWVDVEHPEELYVAALDVAQAEGIYVTMYVGNEKSRAHYPAAWSENHVRIIHAIKDHPALLHFALYNQLTRPENMTEEELQIVEDQIAYLLEHTDRKVDVEVCGDHTNPWFHPQKILLMEMLRDWGVEIISTDVAPIGGWSRSRDHTIWESRIEKISELGLVPMGVLQAHIPFRGPEMVTPADIHLQFWMNVAAGAKGIYYEAAYVYNNYSIRGLMSWDLKLLPDSRAGAVAETLGYVPALATMLSASEKVEDPELASGLMIQTDDPESLLVRMRTHGDQSWILFINRNTEEPLDFTLARPEGEDARLLDEIAPGNGLLQIPPADSPHAMTLGPGRGVCFKIRTP